MLSTARYAPGLYPRCTFRRQRLIRLYELLKNNSHLFDGKPKLPGRDAPAAWVCIGTMRKWWRMTGSNRRPPACKAGALPAELIPHVQRVVGLVGFEPTTPALSRRCSNRLSYRPT